ncbi:MAG: hydroxyacylglutathione hydrolase [Alphaproteobacteria bacterium]|nr:hydroxyacylglutathione hydrolase [Alphaproteobacteria bacterium]
MSRIVVEPLPVLSDNYVWLLREPETGATAAVDPAVAEPVLDALARLGWSLTHVLATHHHHDHIGGIPTLKKETGCTVVGARADAHRIPGLDVPVGEGDLFMLGAAAIRVMEVPGHTIGHLAFWFPDSQALFCGDTLFTLGCGRLFEGTAEQMWASLTRLRRLPGDTMVYCGHEYTQSNARFARTVERDNEALKRRVVAVDALRAQGLPTVPGRLDDENETNPFLRADQPGVARAVGMEPGSDPARVFAELRRRKDVF